MYAVRIIHIIVCGSFKVTMTSPPLSTSSFFYNEEFEEFNEDEFKSLPSEEVLSETSLSDLLISNKENEKPKELIEEEEIIEQLENILTPCTSQEEKNSEKYIQEQQQTVKKEVEIPPEEKPTITKLWSDIVKEGKQTCFKDSENKNDDQSKSDHNNFNDNDSSIVVLEKEQETIKLPPSNTGYYTVYDIYISKNVHFNDIQPDVKKSKLKWICRNEKSNEEIFYEAQETQIFDIKGHKRFRRFIQPQKSSLDIGNYLLIPDKKEKQRYNFPDTIYYTGSKYLSGDREKFKFIVGKNRQIVDSLQKKYGVFINIPPVHHNSNVIEIRGIDDGRLEAAEIDINNRLQYDYKTNY